MTKINRGKQFENVIRGSFLKIPNVSVDRLHDQMTGFKVTSANVCDFIVYKKPYEYYIECKSVHGASLPFSNITDNQWNGLLEKSKIDGVFAGVICWFIDKDVTLFIPIQLLQTLKEYGDKSIRFNTLFKGVQTTEQYIPVIDIKGKKKRVLFDYDMQTFFNEMEK